MKKYLIIFLVLTPISVCCGNKSDSLNSNMISIGVNYLPAPKVFGPLEELARFYQISYKRSVNIKWRLRSGVNFNYFETHNIDTTMEYKSISLGLNFGTERMFYFKKRMELFAGFDLLILADKNWYPMNTNTNVKGAGIAIGSVVGFGHNLTSKFSVSTEINYDIAVFMKKTLLEGTRYGLDWYSHRFLSLTLNYEF